MSETSELAAETLHLQRTARVVGDPRILIIDDEAAIRESLDTLLTLEGFTVSIAVDGPSGLELLSRNEYDLLLLDLGFFNTCAAKRIGEAIDGVFGSAIF